MYLCGGKKLNVQMKGMRLLLAGLVALGCLAAQAAGPVRYQYKNKGITHVSADYDRIAVGDTPFWVRTESVVFPDGSAAWLLYLNIEGAKAVNVPKGVKMAVTLSGGKMIRLEQIGTDNATKRALSRDKDRYYLNRLKYMVDPADMTNLCAGVSSLDIVTGWDPDDYVQVNFPGTEFSKVLSAQVAAVGAAGKAEELSGEIARYADNNNSLMVVARPEAVKGTSMAFNVGLTYLYYKNKDQEDFDLSVQVGTDSEYRIPLESEVVFLLGNGSQVILRQTRDEVNRLFLYPSVTDVRRMIAAGVRSLTFQAESGAAGDTFDGRAFSEALNRQYQLLMSVSPK